MGRLSKNLLAETSMKKNCPCAGISRGQQNVYTSCNVYVAEMAVPKCLFPKWKVLMVCRSLRQTGVGAWKYICSCRTVKFLADRFWWQFHSKVPWSFNTLGEKIDTKQPAEIDRTFFGRATADLSFDNCTVWL